MNYAQAKLAATDHTITDWRWLHEASAFLLGSMDASEEDISDAADLAKRSIIIQCQQIKGGHN